MKLGVAILQYSTYPAPFPTQLNQLLSTIQHIIFTGVPASRVCLAGDSAGANILFQLVGHILHPSPSPSELSSFVGMCLISPWSGAGDIRTEDDSFDLVPSECLGLWMDTYLSTMPASHHVYVQLDTVTEVLYSSIVRLSEAMERAHACVELDVQTGGVHCDTMFDIGAKSKAPHPVERRVVDWLAETLSDERLATYQ
ncbi:hypothetical protein C8F04DRAFT_1251091 [Mycena alexandri]|uniref:Alpha/beta hydrolase fold-3 domain-containing protein n=1 Tax=Mycena alexandri TaxID=1745969 RepID=A0AAD6TD24_9AGAR|nr:hypothetical protein C8F04DRAFT_1251091 [Mycena alexandri]